MALEEFGFSALNGMGFGSGSQSGQQIKESLLKSWFSFL